MTEEISAPCLLLIDDDHDVLGANARYLRINNYQVIVADCAEAALERLKEQVIDVAVTDLRMPGMDGISFAREARLLKPLLPIVVCLASLWIAYAENGVYARTLAKTGQAWQFTWVDWASGILVLVGALELTRRLTGWIIPVLVLLSMAYILGAGQFLPGAFLSLIHI